jgi:hypothetical protein
MTIVPCACVREVDAKEPFATICVTDVLFDPGQTGHGVLVLSQPATIRIPMIMTSMEKDDKSFFINIAPVN